MPNRYLQALTKFGGPRKAVFELLKHLKPPRYRRTVKTRVSKWAKKLGNLTRNPRLSFHLVAKILGILGHFRAKS